MDKKPNIKNYLYVNDFLKDLYLFQKQKDPKFSYELWAKQLGLNNKSFLRQIIMGRRALTDSTLKIFSDNLEFDHSEKEYFQLMVLYSKAKSAEQRNLYGREMRRFIKADYSQEEILNAQNFILKPLYPRLQTLLGFTDVEKNVDALSSLLKLPTQEIQAALAILEQLNLAEPVQTLDKIQWQAKTKAFKVPSDLGNESLLDYHEQSLKEAIKARSLDKNSRRYRSLLMALSEKDFEDFLADLEIFVKQTLSKYDSDEFLQRKLFQFNFNIHAVSGSLKKDAEVTISI